MANPSEQPYNKSGFLPPGTSRVRLAEGEKLVDKDGRVVAEVRDGRIVKIEDGDVSA